jgi:hypothetical protein
MRSALPLLVVLALSACATIPATAPIRADGLAHLGETSRVGTLVVTPLNVVDDSRCPINARCIWAGRLVLTAAIEGKGWHEVRNLTLGVPAVLHGTTLSLTSAEPGKTAGAEAPATPTLFGLEGGR